MAFPWAILRSQVFCHGLILGNFVKYFSTCTLIIYYYFQHAVLLFQHTPPSQLI